MEALMQHKHKQDQQAFYAALNELFPQLKHYVANRLRTAVRKGWVPRGMYEPLDIVDEIYAQVYASFDARIDEQALKTLLFKLADQKLEEIIQQERAHMRDLSIEVLAEKELEALEEHMTADAEGEVVFVEELDDISYHQQTDKPKIYLLDEAFEEELLNVLDLPRKVLEDAMLRKKLAYTYQTLPTLSRIVLDLRTRGGLSTEAVAQIRGMQVDKVARLEAAIRARFYRALGLAHQ